MTDKDDNVEYFPGKKPGFYKKGAGDFKISLGSLDDFIEGAEEQLAEEEAEKKPEIVPDPDDSLRNTEAE